MIALTALLTLTMMPSNEIEPIIIRYAADEAILERKYPVRLSAIRKQRFRKFYEAELQELEKQPFAKLSKDAQIDYLLLKNKIEHEIKALKAQDDYDQLTAPLLPFADSILQLEVNRRAMEPLNPPDVAKYLTELDGAIRKVNAGLQSDLDKGLLTITNGVEPGKTAKSIAKSTANRALQKLQEINRHFDDWYRFYAGYDPTFTWWCEAPYKSVDQTLQSYTNFVREKLIGIRPDDKTTIIGFPIGRAALLDDLHHEMIPYSPEELVEIANQEFAWCEKEMAKATKELGKGSWQEALEYVKQQYVQPGQQPALIKELAIEAIQFLEKRNLVTIPALCKESWRMEMMTPEQQLQSPFFLGGETILVSYPTNGMSHEAKLMSLRGNNRYFARATVQHELIPGHHLQGFMLDRYHPYRQLFNTPFWIEGWALYWEMLLWELGFPKTPEEKIGMLFWRMHRCARIIFSLNFHLGMMTPQECVDFLVERVGHERENALAEVRRSFAGNYGPLYQAAYMLGGLQIMALKHELVDTKKMNIRDFHDAILQGNLMPIEMVRANVIGQQLDAKFATTWRFFGTK